MKIRFGMQLDGQHGWAPSEEVNAITVGPLGMLNILETQMGLLGLTCNQAERIVQYRDCLKKALTEHRFYAKSFATDELGTAATLLQWRDTWHLHGWQPEQTDLANVTGPAANRINDLWAVEQWTTSTLAPCLGERLAAVEATLRYRRPAMDQVWLCEPMSAYPKRWQSILQQLPCAPFEPCSGPVAPGMLGEVQTALQQRAQGQSVEKLAWRDDGSLQLVQAETRLLAGRWLATELTGQPDDTLIVAGDGASQLDDVLAGMGRPRQGFKEASAFRPALQVLSLWLEQLWRPLDIQVVLQFLTHPVCPVQPIARTRIAEKLAKNPGIGESPAWHACLKRIEEACAKHEVDYAEVRTNIQTWLEIARFDRRATQGAPIQAIEQRVQQLAEFFQKRLGNDAPGQRAVLTAAYQQCTACLNALRVLEEQGETHLRPRQLQKLITQVTARGSDNPLVRSELGASRYITQPAAAIESVPHVVWWQLSAPTLPAPYPWSAQEMAALQHVGVELPALDQVLENLSTDWLQPIFAAQQRLTLILPPAGAERHPVWQMLESLFAGSLPITPLESLLTRPDETRPALTLQPLPKRERFWQLPEGTPIPRKGRDAFSSLESFLYNPYQWLVNYPAELNASRLDDVSDSFLLFGTLAHDLAEIYFKTPDALALSAAAFDDWFAVHFEHLVDSDGVILRAPGRGAELANYRTQLHQAMHELRNQFRAAGIVQVEPESELNGHHQGGLIHGYADLVVTRSDGQKAIVDLKWAGGKKYPEKLANNKHLQLIIYAEILRQQTGQWPELAYFILSKGRLIALNNHFFPNAQVVSRAKGIEEENTPQIWTRFQRTWAWRKAQQDAGLIELAISDDDLKDGLSTWPEDGLVPDLTQQNYNDALRLAGWENEA